MTTTTIQIQTPEPFTETELRVLKNYIGQSITKLFVDREEHEVSVIANKVQGTSNISFSDTDNS